MSDDQRQTNQGGNVLTVMPTGSGTLALAAGVRRHPTL